MKKQCKCKKGEIIFKGYSKLFKISSDERFKTKGGEVLACKTCGLIQKKVDANFKKKINLIYKNYSAYPLTKGNENLITLNNKNFFRSDIVINHINKNVFKLNNKKILDLGCGSGFTLKRISHLYPENKLFAHDYDKKEIKQIKQIKNFENFYTGSINKIKNKFDLIILMHVFEHVEHPINFLNILKKKLTPNGIICIQSPNIKKNFLDILTFDHISHFSKTSLKVLLSKTLFNKNKFFNLLKKEITCVVYNHDNKKKVKIHLDKNKIIKEIKNFQKKINKINDFKNHIKKLKKNNSKSLISIFGTTVPSIWIANEIGLKKIHNFFDEDKFKIDKTILQKKIINPKYVKKNSILVFPCKKNLAKEITKKYENLDGILKSF